MDTIVSGGHTVLSELSNLLGGGSVFGKVLGSIAIIMLGGIYRHIKSQINEVMQKLTYTLCYLKSVDKANESADGKGADYAQIRERELARLLREEGFISPP